MAARTNPGRLRWLVPLAGLALLTILFLQIGPRQILTLLGALGTNFLVIVAIFSCHEAVRALALGQCIGPTGRPRYRQLLRVRFLGEAAGALTRTGPLAGEPTRAYVLARRAERVAHTVGASASELIANSLASAVVTVVVAGIMLWRHAFHGPLRAVADVLFWGSVGFVAMALAALMSRTYLIGGLVRRAKAWPVVGRRIALDPAHVRQMEDAILHALTGHGATVAAIASLELLAQGILVFEVYWSLRSMGLPVSLHSALVLEMLIKAPNIIQFIGATEGGFALIFDWVGLTAAAGFALSLVRILRSLAASGLWLAILPQLDEPWPAPKQAPNGSPS